MVGRIRGFVGRWPRVFGVVWLSLVAGAVFAAGYALVYGPLALLAYWATPLAVLAVAVSLLRGGRAGSMVRREIRVAPVLAWWVFGCAVGGVVGGLGYLAQFVGELIFFGGLLGVAQWLVLRMYLRGAGFWVVASFFGWIVGQVVGILAQEAFPGVVDAVLDATGNELFGYAVFDPVPWTVYGLAQGLVLLGLLGRRALVWLLPWIVASASGGVLEALAIYLDLNVLLGARGFGGILSVSVWQAAICALYGVPTGLVLGVVLRRARDREQED